MDYDKALARIYEHLDENHVDKAVMGCLRIARHAKDHLHSTIFLRELYPSEHEVARVLYDDISHLSKEARKFLRDTSFNHWLDLHTLDFSFSSDEDGEKRNVFCIAVGELEDELDQWERSITDMTLPAGMGSFDTAAFTDRFIREKAKIRLRIKAIQTIKARLKARCLNYAIQIESQLERQLKSQNYIEAVQNDVNNFFKARSEEVYVKLQKATQLAVSDDLEDASLLLTEVRRALHATADFFYPPVAGEIRCVDGVERELGNDRHLNRLKEFLADRFARSASTELLQAELDYLVKFLHRLNKIASKGVHGSVTLAESRQGLVGLYFFLSNVCQHLLEEVEHSA